MLAAAVACYGDRPFFVTREESLTYREFARRVDAEASRLTAAGVTSGERVGIFLPSGVDLALAYWAAQRVGAVPLPINPMFRAPEIAAAFEVAPVRVVVTDAAGADEMGRLATERPALVRTDRQPGDQGEAGGRDGMGGSEALAADAWSRPPDGVASMFLTSGTTGRPKAVVQTELGQQTALTTMFVHCRLRFGSETVLNALPLFNNFGASGTMNLCVFGGATMVQLERWDCEAALELITAHRATMVLGTPTMYADICERYRSDRHDLSHIRTAVTAGASAPPALIDRFHAITGARMSQAYGATETTGIVIGESPAEPRKPGSIGRAVGSSTIRIVDRSGRVVAPGQPGELVVEGDSVTPGYLGVEDGSGFGPYGWHSGDIAYVDEDGYYFLVDRLKDMIICGGNNVYPAEVEAVLAQHPAVASCAVVGRADDRLGEVPVAVVVPRASERIGKVELEAFCRERIAAYKVPREFYATEALPLNPTNKVMKPAIRTQVADGILSVLP